MAIDRLKRSIVKPYSLPFLSRYPRCKRKFKSFRTQLMHILVVWFCDIVAAVDCSLFSDSCSLCTAANKQAENTCVWCVSVNTCTALTQCTSTFINSSTRCYSNPIIRYFLHVPIDPRHAEIVYNLIIVLACCCLFVNITIILSS